MAPGRELLSDRRKQFTERFVEPLVAEAVARLGIDADEIVAMIGELSYAQRGIRP